MSNDFGQNSAISCHGLSMAYPVEKDSLKTALNRGLKNLFSNQPKPKEYSVFADISFEVQKGEVFGIIGRNGCGKTTLLKILSRVLVPKSGTALIGVPSRHYFLWVLVFTPLVRELEHLLQWNLLGRQKHR